MLPLWDTFLIFLSDEVKLKDYDFSKITALGNDTTWTQVSQLPEQIFFFSYRLPVGTFDAKVC